MNYESNKFITIIIQFLNYKYNKCKIVNICEKINFDLDSTDFYLLRVH